MNRKLVPFLIFAAGAAGAALLAPSIIANVQDGNHRTSTISGRGADIQQGEIELEQAAQRRAIAESRYESGCLFILETATNTYVSLASDMTITDRLTGKAVPDDVVICDIYGNTALTANGQPRQIFFTGNNELVRESLARAEKNLQFVGNIQTIEAANDGGVE